MGDTTEENKVADLGEEVHQESTEGTVISKASATLVGGANGWADRKSVKANRDKEEAEANAVIGAGIKGYADKKMVDDMLSGADDSVETVVSSVEQGAEEEMSKEDKIAQTIELCRKRKAIASSKAVIDAMPDGPAKVTATRQIEMMRARADSGGKSFVVQEHMQKKLTVLGDVSTESKSAGEGEDKGEQVSIEVRIDLPLNLNATAKPQSLNRDPEPNYR